ncbi:hypothetical protein EYR41_008654 [Orbilia oligospora]|uniref:Uncharacterized protein n=1 Tax=Orbilia oligospora TaxID=2813651 RepID=A0A7C8TSR8_ORBOL|nr:hypothetical protein TWF751_002401 [Orbilia oligospora]KAF3291727.1 hypothetical protein TWF132_006475 [Orbilia oligospora]TGJ67072.1 hypothetical protein EYR41_008654 [Orbilia oligospora]
MISGLFGTRRKMDAQGHKNTHKFDKIEIHAEGERSKAFDAVDKIRELQIGEISLPQLVAVGDQSCGKSSLLESITGISFPVGSDLCTRFATQIVLRRTDATDASAVVQATILPGPGSISKDATRKKLESFRHVFKESEFGPKEFRDIIIKAGKAMGIENEVDEMVSGKRFSDDILKIELSASHHPHLTIVDVPGLFHNPTKHQTEEDKVLIRKLIENYTEDKRTIIMAVMDGRNNLAIQEVFKMARTADPEGRRTVGVITKCDVVQPGEENGPMNIAANKVEYLRHGWFVVRNRSTKESNQRITADELRKHEDEFLKKDPWCTLDPQRVGVPKLKEFLGRLLHEHIQSELPRLAEEINAIIIDSTEKLGTLGEARTDLSKQRLYLTLLAKDYENKVTEYLNGQIGQILPKSHPLKVRTRVQDLHDEYAAAMKTKGHSRPFKTMDGRDEGRDYNLEATDQVGEGLSEPRDIIEWISKAYHGSRGPELRPLINNDMVVCLFRDQAKNWRTVTESHIKSVVDVVKEFNSALLTRIITEETVRRRITMRITKEMAHSIAAAYDLLENLIEDEFGGILQTVDDDYMAALNKSKATRIQFRLMGNLVKEMVSQKIGKISKSEKTPEADVKHSSFDPAAALADWLGKATDAFAGKNAVVEDIHDILKAYYPIALRRFIATVNSQVVERKLLGKDGPLRLFRPDYITVLEDEELNTITREDTQIANLRQELQSRLDRATRALEAANSI